MKKLSILAMVLVICLAAVGVGYAGFTDRVHIEGIVDTAELNVECVELSGMHVYKVVDNPDYPQEILVCHYKHNPDGSGFVWLDTNPGSVEGVMTPYVSRSYGKCLPNGTIRVVYDNIFPSVDFEADALLCYTGTIPVKINAINIDIDLPEGLIMDGGMVMWDENHDGVLQADETTVVARAELRITRTNPDGTTYTWLANVGDQIHTDDTLYLLVIIHLPQDNSLQGLHLTGTCDIELIQWDQYGLE